MKQKFYSLDLIRILAATLVIIVHTKGVFFDNPNCNNKLNTRRTFMQ